MTETCIDEPTEMSREQLIAEHRRLRQALVEAGGAFDFLRWVAAEGIQREPAPGSADEFAEISMYCANASQRVEHALFPDADQTRNGGGR